MGKKSILKFFKRDLFGSLSKMKELLNRKVFRFKKIKKNPDLNFYFKKKNCYNTVRLGVLFELKRKALFVFAWPEGETHLFYEDSDSSPSPRAKTRV